jgi:bacillithiol biosynthesis cysteine-adding enzyme BshC
MLPPLVTAFVEESDLDLLAPIRFLRPGNEPSPSNSPRPDRSEVARALAAANSDYGHPGAEELASRLADPATRVVITGQQPGLFGGPLYTLSKAVAAVRWVERLRQRGESAVAVFWMASEDHDFRESSRAAFFTGEGPRQFDLGDDGAPLMPVGMRTFGPRVTDVLEELAAVVPGERFAEWLQTLQRWYRPEARFTEAFARLLVHLLGEHCPLLVDAMLPGLKDAQRPWLRRLIEMRQRVGEIVAERDAMIESRGFELQVQPQPETSPLFLLHRDQRRRIEWRGEGRLSLRGSSEVDEPVAWLLEAIDRLPGTVSPGVLARSAIQDAVFGTDLQILGPGELSYLPQVAPLYELLGIDPPEVALRPQVLVLEERQRAKIEATGLSLAELVAPELDLETRLFGGAGEDFLAPVCDQVDSLLEQLREAAVALDSGLDSPWRKTRDQMRRALETFSGRVTEAAARKNDVERRRAESLRMACRPLGRLQERVIATAHFPGKYGQRFNDALLEQLDESRPTTLQVVCP